MKKIACLFFLLPLLLHAQEWTVYESVVETVPENGYYNIRLTQQMIGASRNNQMDDIRVYDSSGAEVPYFIRSEEVIREIPQTLYYDLLENAGKDSINRIILRNPDGNLINRFLIISRLAEVHNSVQVRGSNDRDHWFIVKQFQDVAKRSYNDQIHEILVVDFPPGNYQYYEITIRNSGSSPLNIAGVVKTENQQIYQTLSPLPVFDIVQKDSSDRHTYLFFSNLPQTFRFDKVDFFLSYPSDYFRQVAYAPGNRFTFRLSSNSDNSFYTQTTQLTEKNYFRIDNQNNPPLKVDSVCFYGLDRYLCAYLAEGDTYTVVIDGQDTKRPKYDIEHFRNEIPSEIPVLKTTLPIVSRKQVETRKTLWIERPVVLWSIIVGVGVFLLFLCWRVMRQDK